VHSASPGSRTASTRRRRWANATATTCAAPKPTRLYESMSDRAFFAILFTVVGTLVFADCWRSHVQLTKFQEGLRKAYEKCDAEGIPRVRCPL
jgi:hypothetical protein